MSCVMMEFGESPKQTKVLVSPISHRTHLCDSEHHEHWRQTKDIASQSRDYPSGMELFCVSQWWVYLRVEFVCFSQYRSFSCSIWLYAAKISNCTDISNSCLGFRPRCLGLNGRIVDVLLRIIRAEMLSCSNKSQSVGFAYRHWTRLDNVRSFG